MWSDEPDIESQREAFFAECDRKGLYIEYEGNKRYFEELAQRWEAEVVTLDRIKNTIGWKLATPEERERVAKLLPYFSQF